MSRKFEKLFRSPYAVPNCLQSTDEGLWIVDQITDRVALVDPVTPVDHYGVNKWIREIATESSNTSGLSYGDGALWLGANGPGTLWRPIRDTDAQEGDIFKVDPATGKTLARYPLPGGGGTHGLDYDHFEPGMIWLTTLKSQTLTKVRIADWSIQKVLELPYNRAHGVVRVEDGVWVVFTSDRVIVKFDTETGKELDRVEVPKSEPEPHGLSIYGKDFLYCDATSGWVTKITL